MRESLPIPGWFPLREKELKLLEACAIKPQRVSSGGAARDLLESKGLILCVGSLLRFGDRTYIATDKGVRALEVQKIMKELGIRGHRRPLWKSSDSDLVDVLALLGGIAAERELSDSSEGASKP